MAQYISTYSFEMDELRGQMERRALTFSFGACTSTSQSSTFVGTYRCDTHYSLVSYELASDSD